MAKPEPAPKSVVPPVESVSPTAKVAVEPPTPDPVMPLPTVIMTEADAYIHERVASQPRSLDEVRTTVVQSDIEKNRLSLPDYLERFSYDCTQGRTCKAHPWTYDEATGRWSYSKRGEFVFRWTKKVKRAIDHAMNVNGWFFVNRRYFPDAPHHLFSANGGIELGDVILFFLPAKQALALRAAPGKRSSEAVHARMTRVKAGSVLMTGDPTNPNVYMPEGGGDEDEAPTDGRRQIVEGQDF